MANIPRFAFRIGVTGRVSTAFFTLTIAFCLCSVYAEAVSKQPCEKVSPQACLTRSIDAMGGQARLEAIKTFSLTAVGHTALVEQSYRQDPFITSYERVKAQVDLSGKRIRLEAHSTWPESDPGQAESDATLVVSPEGGVHKSSGPDSPCSLSEIDWARDTLALGPLRLLITALHAPDLKFAASETLRSTAHTVLAFQWNGTPVRILLNPFNDLPDAVETVGEFRDHWYQWGDVRRRIYFDNWQTFHGIVYPTNQIEERNGTIWHSTQVLSLAFNVALKEDDFKMDAKAVQQSAQSKGWERPFTAKESSELAPGIRMFPGAWNATLVQQNDGVIILEAPISGTYASGVIDEAKRQYPKLPIKAVLSTSDSWPHIGGVRQAVASGLPVYILDLNRPLLDRLVASPRTVHPDLLAREPKKPVWRIVSGKTEIGSGANRMELYPLHGASTERQYMVYFPEHKLLYASDTLALNDDDSLYDPELMREVMQAVKREGLEVKTVFAMHQGPVAWEKVVALVEKAGR